MKISDTNKIGAISPAKKAKKSGQTGDFDALLDAKEAAPAAPISINSLNPLGALSGILALDDGEGEIEAVKQQINHAETLLSSLDKLKMQMLDGRISPDNAREIVAELKNRIKTNDDGLNELINEIEIRAEVELAKLEMAQKND